MTHGEWMKPTSCVKAHWKYLYRAVDSECNTLDFLLSAKRDARAAERFFRKTLNATHSQTPRVINFACLGFSSRMSWFVATYSLVLEHLRAVAGS